MGEAKRRGDYEKRKAEAMTAGRVKVTRERTVRLLTGKELLAVVDRLSGIAPPKKGIPDARL